jgi:RNA polymerase sigma factor (sigma-70 family)
VAKVIEHLRGTVGPSGDAGSTDGEILQRFLDQHDDIAFAVLVHRHAPMVWGVCRRLLGHVQDAEDAFQATFLILVRKAASVVPRQAVGGWLHGVAYNTALKARAAIGKRRRKERQMEVMPEREASPHDVWGELQLVLDKELNRLPLKYRLAVVLCDLEGRSRKEAARQLRILEGTLSSRLTTARAMLAKRLVRHGVTLSGMALAGILSQNVASARLPASVVSSTIKAVTLVSAEQTAAGLISAKVAALTEGVIKAMFLTKFKIAIAMLLLVATVGLCVGGLAYQLQARPLETAKAQPIFVDGMDPPDIDGFDPPASAKRPPVQAPKAEKKPAEDDAKGKTDPADVALEARLVAKKDTYTLDLGGKTPEEFRKLLHDGPYPASPEVDLVLELHNTGDKEIKFLVGGRNPDIPLLLQLHGHGAVNVKLPALAAGVQSANPEQVTLAPGKSYTLAIKSLRTSSVGRDGSASWWTGPGEYKLIATYETAVWPAPKDAKASHWDKTFGTVTLTTGTLKLKVVEPEK